MGNQKQKLSCLLHFKDQSLISLDQPKCLINHLSQFVFYLISHFISYRILSHIVFYLTSYFISYRILSHIVFYLISYFISYRIISHIACEGRHSQAPVEYIRGYTWKKDLILLNTGPEHRRTLEKTITACHNGLQRRWNYQQWFLN